MLGKAERIQIVSREGRQGREEEPEEEGGNITTSSPRPSPPLRGGEGESSGVSVSGCAPAGF